MKIKTVSQSYLYVENDNELLFGLNTAKKMVVHQNGAVTTLPLCCGHTIDNLFNGWHKHCFTWKAGGPYKVSIGYVRSCNASSFRLLNTVLNKQHDISIIQYMCALFVY